jgi:hypothetical protein
MQRNVCTETTKTDFALWPNNQWKGKGIGLITKAVTVYRPKEFHGQILLYFFWLWPRAEKPCSMKGCIVLYNRGHFYRPPLRISYWLCSFAVVLITVQYGAPYWYHNTRKQNVQKMLLLMTKVNGYTIAGSGFLFVFKLLRSVLYKFRNSPVLQRKVL